MWRLWTMNVPFTEGGCGVYRVVTDIFQLCNFYRHVSRCYQDFRTTFILIYIILCTRSVNLLSAEPEISVSGPVGSTAVLPCELTSVDTDRPYIKWSTESEKMFEREGEESYRAEGYEGRVDVPVEELRKGNCSLVWSNLTFTDTGVYTSYLAVRRTNGSPNVKMINSVKLSVHNRTEETPDKNSDSSDNRGRNHHHLWVLVLLGLVLLGLGVYALKRRNIY